MTDSLSKLPAKKASSNLLKANESFASSQRMPASHLNLTLRSQSLRWWPSLSFMIPIPLLIVYHDTLNDF